MNSKEMKHSKATFMEILEDIAMEAWDIGNEEEMDDWMSDEIWMAIDDGNCRHLLDDLEVANRVNDLAPYLIPNIIENELEEMA